jgi:hypothetical protein
VTKKKKAKIIISDRRAACDNKLTIATMIFSGAISILLCAHDDKKLGKLCKSIFSCNITFNEDYANSSWKDGSMSEFTWLHAALWLIKYKPAYDGQQRALQEWQTDHGKYGYKALKIEVYCTEDVLRILHRVTEEAAKERTYFEVQYAPSFTKYLENTDDPQSFLLPDESQGNILLTVNDPKNVQATAITSPSKNFKTTIFDAINDENDDDEEIDNDDNSDNNNDVEMEKTYTGQCMYFPGEFWGYNFETRHTIIPTDEKTFEHLKQKLINTGCKVQVNALDA